MVGTAGTIDGSERYLGKGYRSEIMETWEDYDPEFEDEAVRYYAVLYKGDDVIERVEIGAFEGGGDAYVDEIDPEHRSEVMKKYEKTIHKWEKTELNKSDEREGNCPPGYEYVKSYHKRDGTYVRGHCAKKPKR